VEARPAGRRESARFPAGATRQVLEADFRRIYAAEHDTTVYSLVRELLQEKLETEARVRIAAKRFLEIAENGPYVTADVIGIAREELHERS
jgi:hypothetical protein